MSIKQEFEIKSKAPCTLCNNKHKQVVATFEVKIESLKGEITKLHEREGLSQSNLTQTYIEEIATLKKESEAFEDRETSHQDEVNRLERTIEELKQSNQL